MTRLPNASTSSTARASHAGWQRFGRALRRLHGLAYGLVAAGAVAAVGMQPPHAAAVEMGTLMVATAAGDDLAWPDIAAPDTIAPALPDGLTPDSAASDSTPATHR